MAQETKELLARLERARVYARAIATHHDARTRELAEKCETEIDGAISEARAIDAALDAEDADRG